LSIKHNYHLNLKNKSTKNIRKKILIDINYGDDDLFQKINYLLNAYTTYQIKYSKLQKEFSLNMV